MMGLPILLHVVEPFISETKASMAWHKMHQPQRLGRGRKLPLPSSLQSSPFLPASNHSRGAWAFIYTPAVASAQQSVDSMGSGGGMLKAVASKGLVVKINVALLGFFVFAYVALYDHNATELVSCSSRACHTKKVEGVSQRKAGRETRATMETAPGFLRTLLHGSTKIGLVNMEEEQVLEWGLVGRATAVDFEPVSDNFKWEDLFPEWIDEEEENEGPSCPEIPLPDLSRYGEMDAVVAELPCRARDVFRLQVHLVVANLAARRGRRGARGEVRVALRSACRPMMELFRCDDLVARDGEWWMYEAEARRLEAKLALPVGSCNLALPLWEKGADVVYDASKLAGPGSPRRREAYATVLHSSDMYVCGAIALARSITRTGSTRDLVLLHDASIPHDKLRALVAAGWTLRQIERIRNPRARKGTYNEYNYSKLRLWQLTDYHEVVFIDADVLVLRNLDLLFHFPQISATGNDGVIFNSGVMVIEPSNCTFNALMALREDVVSYNGGDQGFLNEVFVWWHRLPRRVNFLKNFWSNTTAEASMKNHLFAADPPQLYSIHYLGIKPWMCYREYDCNWNVGDQRAYASDAAHATWWKLHDKMEEGLQKFCVLSGRRREQLEQERRQAAELEFGDGHWRLKATQESRNVTKGVSTSA
ncbi:Glycosyl transferase family 8 [Musa troglodytarum]|uniref:Hexosyltransferase n=1 Tax=Musa troglodytarum TaxID=320322 RepID=A0A9E7JLT5_9LILI|nr:Glycosyl transferase family 8 [Musa troglodytarum]